MNIENVTTEDFDTATMKYATARITMSEITPSQLESIVAQLRGFCQHPPKKDLIFDKAIKVVNEIVFPLKKNEIRLEHPDKKVGRPPGKNGYAIYCPGIMERLRIKGCSISELRRDMIPCSGVHDKEYKNFYVALRIMKKDNIIGVKGDYLYLLKDKIWTG